MVGGTFARHVICVNLAQPKKAYSPIEVTLSEIVIDDVIKNVDEAVRVRVYKNGESETYAKIGKDGKPEKHTIPFEDDKLIKLDHVENFKPGDIIKYTIVFWLEGSDPECNDNILGGEIKMHMQFNSEYVEK